MRRCADVADCGFDNRDNDKFCRGCALPLTIATGGAREVRSRFALFATQCTCRREGQAFAVVFVG